MDALFLLGPRVSCFFLKFLNIFLKVSQCLRDAKPI